MIYVLLHTTFGKYIQSPRVVGAFSSIEKAKFRLDFLEEQLRKTPNQDVSRSGLALAYVASEGRGVYSIEPGVELDGGLA